MLRFDGGVPGSRIKVTLYFGDDSGSHSEKYKLDVLCVAGDGMSCSRSNANYGKGEPMPVALKPGCAYEVRLFHQSCKYPKQEGVYPDYDYTLELRDLIDGVVLDDPQGLFGLDETSVGAESFCLCARTVSTGYRDRAVIATWAGSSDVASYTVYACYFIAYVDQPSYGEVDRAFALRGLNVDVGHAFWEMRCRPVPESVEGISSSDFLNKRVGFYGDGSHVPDNAHRARKL